MIWTQLRGEVVAVHNRHKWTPHCTVRNHGLIWYHILKKITACFSTAFYFHPNYDRVAVTPTRNLKNKKVLLLESWATPKSFCPFVPHAITSLCYSFLVSFLIEVIFRSGLVLGIQNNQYSPFFWDTWVHISLRIRINNHTRLDTMLYESSIGRIWACNINNSDFTTGSKTVYLFCLTVL